MDYNRLMDFVKNGMEYNFYLDGDEYWISHNAEGYYLTRVKDTACQEFKTSEELFRDARVDGKAIFEIWEEIKEFF